VKRTYESKRHHWWPNALSGYWADEFGMVTQLLHNGDAVTEAPWTFGHDKHSHNLRFGGPWNSSFEPIFKRADDCMGEVVDWLMTLEAKRIARPRSFSERMLAQPMTTEHRSMLAEILASLITRSPLMRHRIGRRVKSSREHFPTADIKADTTTIAHNMRPLLAAFTNRMSVTGKFALLFSEDRELIFGDGFFSTFPTNGHAASNARCIVPLTPSMAVLYTSPFRYVSNCDLVTMTLRDEEVEFLNLLVQVYSREKLFYRRDRPHIHESFAARQHMLLEEPGDPELNALFAAVAEFPGRSVSDRPSS